MYFVVGDKGGVQVALYLREGVAWLLGAAGAVVCRLGVDVDVGRCGSGCIQLLMSVGCMALIWTPSWKCRVLDNYLLNDRCVFLFCFVFPIDLAVALVVVSEVVNR